MANTYGPRAQTLKRCQRLDRNRKTIRLFLFSTENIFYFISWKQLFATKLTEKEVVYIFLDHLSSLLLYKTILLYKIIIGSHYRVIDITPNVNHFLIVSNPVLKTYIFDAQCWPLLSISFSNDNKNPIFTDTESEIKEKTNPSVKTIITSLERNWKLFLH